MTTHTLNEAQLETLYGALHRAHERTEHNKRLGEGRMRKPLTQSETDDLNSVLERAAQRLERRKALNRMDREQAEATLRGVLAALRNEPRDG